MKFVKIVPLLLSLMFIVSCSFLQDPTPAQQWNTTFSGLKEQPVNTPAVQQKFDKKIVFHSGN